MCKEELHGGALDPPALGDAVEEPRSVVVHDKLEKGALGDERNIVIFKTISIKFFKSYTGLAFRLPPEIPADRRRFPPATEMHILYA